MDALADSDGAHVRSRDYAGVFRTSEEDALRPGWHEWETNYQAGQLVPSDWRSIGLSCETTHLQWVAGGRCGDQPGAVICWFSDQPSAVICWCGDQPSAQISN